MSTESPTRKLALTETCQPHPTSRTFVTEHADGVKVHCTFTTIYPAQRSRCAQLHRPSNRDVNQAIMKMASMHFLKDF